VARKSAAERREEIVGIAYRHFAAGGFNGTSTEAIAREAGVSQPYLFRLFRTKRELFLACSDRCYEQVAEVFREAAESAEGDERMSAMGHAYEAKLLPDRHALMFQMQSHATGDPEIHAHVRDGFNELRRTVAELAGVPEAETWRFFADGMLMNVVAMLDLDWTDPEHQ
jgi:AcrR family transcriptional regulator